MLLSGTLKDVGLPLLQWSDMLTSSFIDLGHFVSNSWAVTTLNDFHNLHNATEVQRLQEEHPGEDDLIEYHRTKGHIGITRGMHTGVNAMLSFFLS